MYVYNVVRVMMGGLIVTGACVGIYNVVRSLLTRPQEVLS
jgi:hypothetical protein